MEYGDEEFRQAMAKLENFEKMRAGVRLRAMDPTAPRDVIEETDPSLSGPYRRGETVSPDGRVWRDKDGALLYTRDDEGYWLGPDGRRMYDPVGNRLDT
ncbi:hypothetical protein ACFWPK_29000 [Nocardia sp. NPDC058519]|uniref:hypothetical protein n=1 Tax=unclassified Nocardia TaxID=2637762 RepID=UPI003667AED1